MEKREVEKNYVLEVMREASIKVLNLGREIEETLTRNGFKTVSDLFLEIYEKEFSKDDFIKIKFERDYFFKRIQNFLKTVKDPERCLLGTFFQYYNILLLFELYQKEDSNISECKKFKVSSLTKDSVSIKGINYILLNFGCDSIAMLKLRATEKLTYGEIANRYGLSEESCRKRILDILEKIGWFEKYILNNTDEPVEVEIDDLDLPIESTKLSARTVRSLRLARINSLEELKEYAINNNVKKLRGIGEKGYNEIAAVLQKI